MNRRSAAATCRILSMAMTVVLGAGACGFQGVNSLPLPGTAGREDGAANYTVALANVGTLEPNSPVMIDDVVVGSVRSVGISDRHAEVTIQVRPGVDVQ